MLRAYDRANLVLVRAEDIQIHIRAVGFPPPIFRTHTMSAGGFLPPICLDVGPPIFWGIRGNHPPQTRKFFFSRGVFLQIFSLSSLRCWPREFSAGLGVVGMEPGSCLVSPDLPERRWGGWGVCFGPRRSVCYVRPFYQKSTLNFKHVCGADLVTRRSRSRQKQSKRVTRKSVEYVPV
jgi:hypothetical protein